MKALHNVVVISVMLSVVMAETNFMDAMHYRYPFGFEASR